MANCYSLGTDGYSRLPVYLTASTRRESTMLIDFWVPYSNMDCCHKLGVIVEVKMLEMELKIFVTIFTLIFFNAETESKNFLNSLRASFF